MKKILNISILLIILIGISILGVFFHKTILNFLINIDVTKIGFLTIYLLIAAVYFLFPLPVTLVILLNGYLFKDSGFYISMCIIIFSSTILFFSSRFIEDFFKIDMKAFFLKNRYLSNGTLT